MFISPKTAIENGWVTHPKCKTLQDWEDNKFICPNAIDFTLDTLFSVYVYNQFIISEHGKQMRGGNKVEPVIDRRHKHESGEDLYFWHLRDHIYDGMSDVYVDLPEGVAAMLIIRSTFNRNGIFLTSGLYDSGFKGHLGFALHNRAEGKTSIAKGTRVGQVIFVASDSAGMYTGGYNHEEGTHYTEKK